MYQSQMIPLPLFSLSMIVFHQKKLQFDQWHTINALFDFSKSFIEQAYQYDIQYDNTYGNPTLMLVDWDSDIADDEVTFFVNNVIKY